MGLNTSFLFSRNTLGVGGSSCSLVRRCVGGSGGAGGGDLSLSIEQLGTPLRPRDLHCSTIVFASMSIVNSGSFSVSQSRSSRSTGSQRRSDESTLFVLDVASHLMVSTDGFVSDLLAGTVVVEVS